MYHSLIVLFGCQAICCAYGWKTYGLTGTKWIYSRYPTFVTACILQSAFLMPLSEPHTVMLWDKMLHYFQYFRIYSCNQIFWLGGPKIIPSHKQRFTVFNYLIKSFEKLSFNQGVCERNLMHEHDHPMHQDRFTEYPVSHLMVMVSAREDVGCQP